MGSGDEAVAVGSIVGLLSFYDPTTGQFLSRDPINALTRSAYGYVNGNPLNMVDPAGLFPIPFTDKCVAIMDDSCDNSGTQNWAGNVYAGAGNALTFGQGVDLTAKATGQGDNFTACNGNSDSWAYRGGAAGGFIFRMAFGAGAAGGRGAATLADDAATVPTRITGYRGHGLNQAISRDGRGVAPRAILDAVRSGNPQYQAARDTFKFVGDNAVVFLNR